MKKRHLYSLIVMLSVMVFMVVNVHAKTWKISHVRPQDTAIDKDLRWFSDAINEKTGGRIKTKVYPASALGDYTVVQERVGLGAIDMACQPPASSADKRFQLVYFPYMMKNWAQAKKNYSEGAPLRKIIAELYAEQNIHLLAVWPVYFGGISLNREPVSPGDPEAAKGIKLRVPPMKTFQLLADSTGYLGTPIPFSDAFTAVQTGVVDGVIGSGAEGYYSSFRDVTKYYIPSNTHFEVWYLILNKETFDDLKPELQKELNGVAAEFEQRRWDSAEADQAANEKRLADYGATIVDITDDQIASIAKKIQSVVWPDVLEDVGTEWGQKVLDSIIE
ncbi:putative DctP (Periplasmic C4-dicarboxylate binding protein) [Desulfamplus magnetovallimortis]|uniref:Putative DctP (Periplasmic C4-dicarboxylate binding protein) n=1 Tax=Desulfamplus magnetovallimortis TaxID=1246637 RepID=A0A1W1HAG2_9BACT|nr:TRAP transporter substrate-binding protein DctP [Desulfamplus magnetovallimortis]SLM29471.1 putative DctP (Periplasmic C4-dicarboxylate binding protein) [Desulfamplus magnetovallimortis]